MKQDLTVVEIINPTSSDFTWNYNGEPYTLKAGARQGFAKPIAFHLAKHLSTKMIVDDASAQVTKKDLANPNAAIHFKIAQLSVNDTSERRIALYQILRDEQRVIQLIQAYPFKGFIGDMETYRQFVEKSKTKEAKEADKEASSHASK